MLSFTELSLRRRLASEFKAHGPHATLLQRAKLVERANSPRRKIELWRAIQAVYMPAVPVLLSRASKDAAPSSAPELTQDIRLFLPSEMSGSGPCNRKLMEYEWRLRFAQAQDALDEVRNHLRVRTYMWKTKRRDIRGVAANTRAQATLARQQEKIDASVQKYRAAHRALVKLGDVLEKVGWKDILPQLNPRISGG
jgi:hypothetical protein